MSIAHGRVSGPNSSRKGQMHIYRKVSRYEDMEIVIIKDTNGIIV